MCSMMLVSKAMKTICFDSVFIDVGFNSTENRVFYSVLIKGGLKNIEIPSVLLCSMLSESSAMKTKLFFLWAWG